MTEYALVAGKRTQREPDEPTWSSSWGGFLGSFTLPKDSNSDRVAKKVHQDLQNLDKTQEGINTKEKNLDDLTGQIRVKQQGIVSATATYHAAQNELMPYFQELLNDHAKNSPEPFKRTEDLVADIKNLRAQILAHVQEHKPLSVQGMLDWANKTHEMMQLEDQVFQQQTKIKTLKKEISNLQTKIRAASNDLKGQNAGRFMQFLEAAVGSYTTYTGDTDVGSLNGSLGANMLIAAAHTITEAATATPAPKQALIAQIAVPVEEDQGNGDA